MRNLPNSYNRPIEPALSSRVLVGGAAGGGQFVRLAAAGKRLRDRLASRRDDRDLKSLHRDHVTRLDRHPLPVADRLHIGLVVAASAPRIQRGDGLAVVHEDLARYSGIHPGNVAAVVGIVVGGHDIVELLDSGGLGDLDNPFRVPVVLGRIAGIDEHRLTVGRQQDHRLASLGIDDVDVQRVGGRDRGSQQKRNGTDKEGSHSISLQERELFILPINSVIIQLGTNGTIMLNHKGFQIVE